MKAKFVLSREKVRKQTKVLEDLGLKVSYSYKTNHEVGNILQDECSDVNFSIHSKEEIGMIKDKGKISFFTQAESLDELRELLSIGITSYVVDNEIDLNRLLEAIKIEGIRVSISLRMKFQEHRIGTGKYFVYGFLSRQVNELVGGMKDNEYVDKIGIHIHRKSQNTSEWEIIEELKDSLNPGTLEIISFVNLGGGLPSKYKNYTVDVIPYIFEKLTKVKEWLAGYDVDSLIEPGRFIAAPSVKLEVEVIQVLDNNIVVNTTIYNCCLDTHLTGTKMLVEGELEDNEDGDYYLIKGNSPTRDDIFRYRVKLKSPKVGDIITFINAGAYNYTTDFFGYKKLETEVID